MGAATWDIVRVRKLAALVAFALWLVSLALPALGMVFDPDQGRQVFHGYRVLASGYFAIGAGQFGWLANWVLLIMLIALALDALSDRALRWWAFVLGALSLDALDMWLRPDAYSNPHFLPGYYVWMAANLGIALVVLVPRRRPAPDPE